MCMMLLSKLSEDKVFVYLLFALVTVIVSFLLEDYSSNSCRLSIESRLEISILLNLLCKVNETEVRNNDDLKILV
jgi:hypothetical protein